MIELLSIHIPKTGGTSFYRILQQAYGESAVSISFKRRDYEAAIKNHGNLPAAIPDELKVLHGHLTYRELKSLHKQSKAKVICWLRDPVERVVSNYQFFIHRLQNPEINPRVYELNKHRINESLMTYAKYKENRNVMYQHLKGIPLEDMAFVGFLDHFEEGLDRLANLMNWTDIEIPHLNKRQAKKEYPLSPKEHQQLLRLNRKDIKLYQKALSIAGM
jgi:hypothetical protein